MTMRTTALFLIPGVLLSTFALAPAARAQTAGFAVDRFNPSERGSDWFALDSLDLRGNVRPALGLVLDYGYRPLAIYNADGSVRTNLIEHQLFAHVGGSLVLWDRLRLGLDLPIALYEAGNTGTFNGVTYGAPSSSAGVGDLRLGADVRLLGAYGDPFTLAVGAQLFAPTGSQGAYTGDGSVRVLPHLSAAGIVGAFQYAAQVGFLYRGENDNVGGTTLGSELTYGASAGLRLADGNVVVGPEIFGGTIVTQSGEAFSTHASPLEAILGGHVRFARDWRAGLGAGGGLTRGDGAPEVRVLGSLEWAPDVEAQPAPAADRDGDGVPDDVDACPDTPGVRTGDPGTNGCPADRDHDGIADAQDACPDVPGVATSDPKTNGCPADRDGDGVPDAQDACPDVAGVKTDDPKTNGCPADRDGDGIADAQDACPDVKGVKTDDPKTNGCPPDPDRDKDGIPNDQDACPDQAGPANKEPKKNGCPAVVVTATQIVLNEQVKFATGSATILAASDPILTQVAKILGDHAEIKKLAVEGYTDNVGSAKMNKDLSARRAASVVAWLTKHGIDKARLTSAGYGMERPIDTNDTPEGRQNNRRVEMHILEQDKK